MDVYSLINSKDIAEYLREIHYELIEQYNRAREVFPDFRSCEEDAKEDNCRRRRAIQLGRYGIAAEKRGFFGHVCLWLSSYDGWVRLLSSANAE